MLMLQCSQTAVEGRTLINTVLLHYSMGYRCALIFSTMDHKLLLSGHPESEVDSVHASNERRSKHVSVYIPRYCCRSINMARPRNPYKGFKSENATVWNQYNFSDDLKWFPLRKTNAWKNSSQAAIALQETPLYHKPLLVTESKNEDFLFLCEKGQITEDCQPIYHNLECSNAVEDLLPEVEPFSLEQN